MLDRRRTRLIQVLHGALLLLFWIVDDSKMFEWLLNQLHANLLATVAHVNAVGLHESCPTNVVAAVLIAFRKDVDVSLGIGLRGGTARDFETLRVAGSQKAHHRVQMLVDFVLLVRKVGNARSLFQMIQVTSQLFVSMLTPKLAKSKTGGQSDCANLSLA